VERLKSFVETIEVDELKAKVYYTIPVPPCSVSEETWEICLSYITVEGEGRDRG